jgi:HSP20 family molecular chaperone IbpA
MNEKGEFTYKVDASGFRPEELKVELQGNEIVLQGEHKEQNEGGGMGTGSILIGFG